MATKFGWNEEQLYYVSDVVLQDTSGDPGAPSAEEGSLRVYSSDDGGTERLYIRDSVEAILMPIDAVNLGTDHGLFKQKNADGELEFYGIKSDDGHLDINLVGDDLVFSVDLADINDELDHGALLGLTAADVYADPTENDDHNMYVNLGGRDGGQIIRGSSDGDDDLELRSNTDGDGEVKIIDGSDLRHNKYLWKSSQVQTTDASQVAAFTINLEDAKSYLMEVKVVCQDTTNTERGMFIQSQGAYRDGVAILQGNQNSQHKTRSDGRYKVSFEVTGGSGDVFVYVEQGDIGLTTDWSCELEILELS